MIDDEFIQLLPLHHSPLVIRFGEETSVPLLRLVVFGYLLQLFKSLLGLL